jgi:pimeloyl-ACP methyl ester carboxylesterase
MDAVGCERAGLFGVSEGGAMSMLLAATYPERTGALILDGADGHTPPWVLPPDKFDAFVGLIDRSWGTGESLQAFAPSKASDEGFGRRRARFERLGASPSAALALTRINKEIDVRRVLPSIRVPTRVLYRVEDRRVEVEAGRFLGRTIPGARCVELPGMDHVPLVEDADRLASEVEEFLTGSRPPAAVDQVLTTVLLTDIAYSTRRAVELGTGARGCCSTGTTRQHDERLRPIKGGRSRR